MTRSKGTASQMLTRGGNQFEQPKSHGRNIYENQFVTKRKDGGVHLKGTGDK